MSPKKKRSAATIEKDKARSKKNRLLKKEAKLVAESKKKKEREQARLRSQRNRDKKKAARQAAMAPTANQDEVVPYAVAMQGLRNETNGELVAGGTNLGGGTSAIVSAILAARKTPSKNKAAALALLEEDDAQRAAEVQEQIDRNVAESARVEKVAQTTQRRNDEIFRSSRQESVDSKLIKLALLLAPSDSFSPSQDK
jgi:ADP-ribosylglycohydrolase